MKVYELKYDHQMEPRDYGLFSTLEKAEDFMRKALHVKTEDVRLYGNEYSGYTWIYGNYRLKQRDIA
jgi:hypothetical protein